jgi:UDP-N-acetylmuramyl pentapeptide phosphotransferase/UDP-N-acetylglucosamine-1-phosphate transferase
MGDAGSTPLGLLLACALLLGLDNGSLQAHHLVPLLPLYGDAVYTLLRRTLRLENIFRAHHSHLYQRLMRSGLPHRRVSSLYILLTALCGSLASAWGASGALAAAAVCLACLLAAEIRCARRKVPFTRG